MLGDTRRQLTNISNDKGIDQQVRIVNKGACIQQVRILQVLKPRRRHVGIELERIRRVCRSRAPAFVVGVPNQTIEVVLYLAQESMVICNVINLSAFKQLLRSLLTDIAQ